MHVQIRCSHFLYRFFTIPPFHKIHLYIPLIDVQESHCHKPLYVFCLGGVALALGIGKVHTGTRHWSLEKPYHKTWRVTACIDLLQLAYKMYWHSGINKSIVYRV